MRHLLLFLVTSAVALGAPILGRPPDQKMVAIQPFKGISPEHVAEVKEALQRYYSERYHNIHPLSPPEYWRKEFWSGESQDCSPSLQVGGGKMQWRWEYFSVVPNEQTPFSSICKVR